MYLAVVLRTHKVWQTVFCISNCISFLHSKAYFYAPFSQVSNPIEDYYASAPPPVKPLSLRQEVGVPVTDAVKEFDYFGMP